MIKREQKRQELAAALGRHADKLETERNRKGSSCTLVRLANTAADQFIAGKPLVYTGFNGHLYVATYVNSSKSDVGLGYLEIRNNGRKMSAPIMSESGARSFLWNIDAEVEG